MPASFLLYGSNGFVGEAIARLAVQRGLKPILAGRNAAPVQALAAELGLPCRIFGLDDSASMDKALADVGVLLHCAGPYIHTYKPMVEGCLRTGAHYLDITGEVPVLDALAGRDAEAKARKVMLLPGAGFDVVPTDCLALHLKRRLPSATRLTLAWYSQGPTGFPPGTVNTMFEIIHCSNGFLVRRNGQIESVPSGKWRMIDFGNGPVQATRWTWGDVYMAFYSTGIPNIENYAVLPEQFVQLLKVLSAVRPLLGFAAIRNFFKSKIPSGSTTEERAKTSVAIWGEVEDDQGHKAVSRLHGPEAGGFRFSSPYHTQRRQ